MIAVVGEFDRKGGGSYHQSKIKDLKFKLLAINFNEKITNEEKNFYEINFIDQLFFLLYSSKLIKTILKKFNIKCRFEKFLKLYIYLTDVDEDSGPHIYIPKTHKKKKLENSLPRLYDDHLIYSTYKEKAGFIFFTKL